MKLAILAPSPTPFTIGGAEKLWLGMSEYINRHTTHQCELIKVPIKEDSFWNLIDAYYTFYKLDLSHFDLIITGKYPAWMTQHKNHHIYMLHRLRGFYDCYHFLNLKDKIDTTNLKIIDILDRLKKVETTIDEIFQLLFELKDDKNLKDSSLFDFPGVFIKKLIHFFDNKAMNGVKKFSAISKTVAARGEYFPDNAKVDIVYPPSTLREFNNNSSKYFFTVSRLDEAKRIDMLLRAYIETDTEIPLKIAGTGELFQRLKDIAKGDSRVELLGFVSDDDLVSYYSDAYAVIFIPYDEDYGLVTIEAMMCEKPVITFEDSGGVVEFVQHNYTGLVSPPNIQDLTTNINFLAANPTLSQEMGMEAKRAVVGITWKNTIDFLLGQKNPKKLTVVTTYPIYPPRGGGQNRVYYLYKELAKYMRVDIVCLTSETQNYQKTKLCTNLFEIRVPKSQQHALAEEQMQKEAGIPITDIAMLYLYDKTPLLKQTIEKSYQNSDFLIAIQPYTYPICKSIETKRVIHDSQNVEYKLKKQMLEDTIFNKDLLDKLFEVEKQALQETMFTTVCALDDAKVMQELYNLKSSKTLLVANGVDLDSVPFVSQEARGVLKHSISLQRQKIVLFMGSWHQPNIEAVKEIFILAQKLKGYKFIILGSVGAYFEQHKVEENVGFAGVVDDGEKELYLSISDIAINPMLSGSGTNLKMLDYMANGLPVISTKVGARGLDIPQGCIVECAIDEFEKNILNIESLVDTKKSRLYVESSFSWKTIANHLYTKIEKL